MSESNRSARSKILDEAMHEIADDDAALRKIAEEIVMKSGMDIEIDEDFLSQLRTDALALTVNSEELDVADLVQEESREGAHALPDAPKAEEPPPETQPYEKERPRPRAIRKTRSGVHAELAHAQPSRSGLQLAMIIAMPLLLLSVLIGGIVFLVSRENGGADNIGRSAETERPAPPRSVDSGESESANGATAVSKPQSQKTVFQNGKHDYSHCRGIGIYEAQPGKMVEPSGSMEADLKGKSNKPVYAIIRFDQVFASGEKGQIDRPGRIEKAVLRLYTTDSSSGNFEIHDMRVDWKEGQSLSDVLGRLKGKATAVVSKPKKGQWVEVDVTSSLKAWQSGKRKNYGWMIIPKTTNGWDFVSPINKSAVSQRPELVIAWTKI
jgi:hypothetical protein